MTHSVRLSVRPSVCRSHLAFLAFSPLLPTRTRLRLVYTALFLFLPDYNLKRQLGWLPVIAAVAVRKKVVSIGHFSPNFCFQSLQIFLFVRSNQGQLYVLMALKIREKYDWAKWARWAKMLKIIWADNQLCSLTCFLVFACSNMYQIIYSFITF